MEIPAEAAFRLLTLDTNEDDPFPDFDGIQTRRLDTGQFRAEGVQPGRYRLVARPGGGWLGNLSYFQQAVTEFRLTAGEEVSLALELRLGGRLRIAVRSPDGRALAAACSVRRADGTLLDVWFFRRDGTTLSAGTGLVAGGASEIDRAIPPGRYTIEVSAKGYPDLTRDARVVVNRTTVIDVTLAPR